jgi:site-specific DNA-methyltransferase (adenine-specific)
MKIESNKVSITHENPQLSGIICYAHLYHADCFDIMPKIESKSIDLILADLPYGTTACKWDSILPFEKLWNEYERLITDNGAIVLFGSQPFTTFLIASNIKFFRYCLIWDKIRAAGFLNANRMPLKQHEDICVFYKKQPTYNPQKYIDKPYDKTKYNGSKLDKNVLGAYTSQNLKNEGQRFPKSILTFSQNWKRQDQMHPTQKPVELLKYLIKTYTNKGMTILDNTMGSGSTGVAAKMLQRNFIGIEKELNYFEIAQKRIDNTIIETSIFDCA